MYGNVVLELEHHDFEHTMNDVRKDVAKRKGIAVPADAEELARVVPTPRSRPTISRSSFRSTRASQDQDRQRFPLGSIRAVDGRHRRRVPQLEQQPRQVLSQDEPDPREWGTAVNVQMMVFGNTGDTSGTGVCFTRNPSTGEHKFFGEWLPNAQGEDVVAGIRTPQPIAKSETSGGKSLEEVMPENYAQLFDIQKKLENHFKDMQISSSRSRTAACTCCRPATASARAAPWSRSRSTWSTKADRREDGIQRQNPVASRNCSSPPSIPREGQPIARVCRFPGAVRAKWCSRRGRHQERPPLASKSFWSASRLHPKTSRA
jgi:hypothetical protein